MATTYDPHDGLREWCADCECDTLHEASIQLRTESDKQENARFSREPYRVTECQQCGNRTSQRMNDV